MLSKRIIKNFGIRVQLMYFAGLTIYGWDKENSKLTLPPNKYLFWNWLMCLYGGFVSCLIYAIQLYIKLSNAEEELTDSASFATLVLTWGELIIVLIICLLATRIHQRQQDIMYLVNQMFTFHNQITEWLKERNLTLDHAHKKRIAGGEILIFISAYFSYFFAILLVIILFHPLEPIHAILKEWLDFELTLENVQLAHVALLPTLFMLMVGAGNTIIVFGILVTCYYMIATASLEDMTPVQVTRKQGRRLGTFETEYYGELEDNEIIVKYRVQQLLNVLINDILATFSVSLHHVGCLATCSIVAFFAIKFQDALDETGVIGYVIVGGAFCAPLLIECVESIMLGTIVGISDTFKERADKLVGRGTLMKVFSRSCNTFFVQEAYPYFTIDKGTFLEFVNQVVDYTITLLLW